MITDIPIETQEEMMAQVAERKKSYKPGQSKDGMIQVGRKKYTYKGVSYEIAILRYFTLNELNFQPMSRRVTSYHAVVEYPEETRPLVSLIEEFHSEYLYHDTLHSHNDNQTIEQQVEECHRLARQDIDLIVTIINLEIPAKIRKLQDTANELQKWVRE